MLEDLRGELKVDSIIINDKILARIKRGSQRRIEGNPWPMVSNSLIICCRGSQRRIEGISHSVAKVLIADSINGGSQRRIEGYNTHPPHSPRVVPPEDLRGELKDREGSPHHPQQYRS